MCNWKERVIRGEREFTRRLKIKDRLERKILKMEESEEKKQIEKTIREAILELDSIKRGIIFCREKI